MAEVELELVWGDTRKYELTIRDQVSGDPINLNDGVLRLAAKQDEDDAVPLFELTPGSGILYLTQSGGTLGKAHATVSASNLSAIPNRWRTLLFDVAFTKTVGGEPQTPIRGVFRVKPRVGT